MIRKATIFLLILFLGSCISKKKTTYSKERKITVAASDTIINKSSTKVKKRNADNLVTLTADKVINSALTFSGAPYKFGGITKRGMDCSGLIYVAFGKHDISLPRISHNMAKEGKQIRVKDIEKGDLLFFKTSKRGKKINHVGLVVTTKNNEIKFIHASTSRGVIISSLKEGYWNYAFVKATRVL